MCWKSFSSIFQSYHSWQFNWWQKTEFLERLPNFGRWLTKLNIDFKSSTPFLYGKRQRTNSCWVQILYLYLIPISDLCKIFSWWSSIYVIMQLATFFSWMKTRGKNSCHNKPVLFQTSDSRNFFSRKFCLPLSVSNFCFSKCVISKMSAGQMILHSVFSEGIWG